MACILPVPGTSDKMRSINTMLHLKARSTAPLVEVFVNLQSNGPSVGFALAGGVFLCLGNLATQYSLVRDRLLSGNKYVTSPLHPNCKQAVRKRTV